MMYLFVQCGIAPLPFGSMIGESQTAFFAHREGTETRSYGILDIGKVDMPRRFKFRRRITVVRYYCIDVSRCSV